MKKLIAVMLFALSGAVYAGPYAAVEYETNEDRNTKADSLGAGVIVGTKFDGGLQVSGKVSYSQPEFGNGAITNSFEGRAKQKFGNVYLGARLGERVKSDTNFAYYAIDAGIVLPINAFEIDLSYRYRNAFNESNNFETNRYGVEGKYKFTKNDAVGLRYSQSYGDSETNSWRLQYTRSF